MEKELKKGYICCSVDNACNGITKVNMVVVETIEEAHNFIEVNIKEIKNTVKKYIDDGTLEVVDEISSADNYYLRLENKKRTIFDASGCHFNLDCFEFTYGQPFNFHSYML